MRDLERNPLPPKISIHSPGSDIYNGAVVLHEHAVLHHVSENLGQLVIALRRVVPDKQSNFFSCAWPDGTLVCGGDSTQQAQSRLMVTVQ
jgi:hypothetical protein